MKGHRERREEKRIRTDGGALCHEEGWGWVGGEDRTRTHETRSRRWRHCSSILSDLPTPNSKPAHFFPLGIPSPRHAQCTAVRLRNRRGQTTHSSLAVSAASSTLLSFDTVTEPSWLWLPAAPDADPPPWASDMDSPFPASKHAIITHRCRRAHEQVRCLKTTPYQYYREVCEGADDEATTTTTTATTNTHSKTKVSGTIKVSDIYSQQ